MSEESFVYTACPGWGDHDYCALKTIVKDGQIERMERIVYVGERGSGTIEEISWDQALDEIGE